MRVTGVLLACCASSLLDAPAIAQTAPTRTVDDYVCGFAGGCDQQKPAKDNSIAAPKTRSFSVYKSERKSTEVQPSSPAVSAPAQATRPNMTGGRRNPATVRVANRASTKGARASAVQERRMDLRLSFLLGSAELTTQAQAEAKVFAEALRTPALADKRFLIEGHTDSSGSRAMNLDLSKRRAAAVAEYLSGLGVERSRLDVRGYGPDRPLPGHRPSAPDNRRVEAKLL